MIDVRSFTQHALFHQKCSMHFSLPVFRKATKGQTGLRLAWAGWFKTVNFIFGGKHVGACVCALRRATGNKPLHRRIRSSACVGVSRFLPFSFLASCFRCTGAGAGESRSCQGLRRDTGLGIMCLTAFPPFVFVHFLSLALFLSLISANQCNSVGCWASLPYLILAQC